MKFDQSISWVFPPRDPMDIAQLLDCERLAYSQKTAGRKLHRDHLVISEMREEVLVILQTHHTRVRIREMPIKFTNHGHVIQHFTGSVNFVTQAAFDQSPCES